MDTWLKDFRYALRQLRGAPVFSLAAILTLSVGIGAVTAVFSVANAILLKPLPYHDPDRLDFIRLSAGEVKQVASISAPELIDFRTQSKLYEAFGAFWIGPTVLEIDGEADRVRSGWASANLFPMLGVHPVIGRHFTQEEEKPEGPKVVILSYGLWQSRFGGDPDIEGRVLDLGGVSRTVVGVLPQDFRLLVKKQIGFYDAPELWEPNTYWENRKVHWLRTFGRRKPGVTPAQAQAEFDILSRRLSSEYSEYTAAGIQFHVIPLHDDLVRASRPAILALLGTVAFLLLIACTNVAGMLLARSSQRRGEIALRAALGADRVRLVRQLLSESLLLAFLGAVFGLLLAKAGLDVLVALKPAQLPRLDDIGLDGRVLGFNALVGVATLFIFGLYAALQGSRADLRGLLSEAGRSPSGRRKDRVFSFLVVIEIGLALTLLIGAGLMIRSFAGLRQVALGFEPDRVLSFALSPPGTYDTPDKKVNLLEQAMDEVRGLPGVEAVGVSSILPFTGSFETGHFAFDAETEASFGEHEAEYRFLQGDFFDTIGARLVSGRTFSTQELRERRRVVVVDESLARIAWPGENPLGRELLTRSNVPDERIRSRVVGVVAHVRQEELRSQERPQVYFPYDGLTQSRFVVRSSGELETLTEAIRGRLRELDASVPISDVRPLESYIDDAMADIRFVLVLMSIFAGIAVLLAAVGLYAILSFWVHQRLPGIGVRVALGARRADILALVLRHGLLLVAFGLAAGLLASAGMTRTLESLLFNVGPMDPQVFGGLAVLLLAVALGTCTFPAWRAARVDPVTVLRND